jgi:hypothetical protein
MIFNVPGHIDMIRNGLQTYPPLSSDILPEVIVKTETRRVNRGIYQVGKNYAVQRKRGVKAEPDIRIVMDMIWEEEAKQFLIPVQGVKYPSEIYITKEDALAEGGYTPARFEGLFRELDPKWDGRSRWAFKFHVVEVQK